MVFSSLPLYLDPPNWQQQHPNPQHHEFQSPQVLPPPPAQQAGGGAILMGGSTTAPTSSIRPGSSMADRARQAKIPVPEGPLKCPRCESTNTKFCYFNNYSLSQPRHFCKTCRRYWTRGGSLRSVPVGGGCRRNKRKKSGRAAPKSPSKGELPRHTPPSASVGPSADFSGGNHLLQAVGPPPPPPFSFLASLQNLTQLGMGNLGLNFSALGMGGPNNSGSNLGGYGEDEVHQQGQAQQQLPNLLAGFGSVAAATSSMYPFQSMEGMETASYGKGMGVQNHQLQQAGVKMESVGVGQHHQQFWSNGGTMSTTGATGGMWSDLSGICSSSPSTHTILR